MRAALSLVLLSACATVVEPGEGVRSDDSAKRLVAQDALAKRAASDWALKAANASPQNLRAQRKAAELTKALLRELPDAERPPVYAAAGPTLDRLEAHAERCTTLVEAGEVRSAAGDTEKAAKAFVTSAKNCLNLGAFLSAAWPLKRLGRCPEVPPLAEAIWPVAEQNEWVRVMDAVASCSDAVTLRQNLRFVPQPVLQDYFALLAKRERDRERQEAEWRAQEKQQAARNRCESECWSARSSCSSSCGSASNCWSLCQSLESTCRAGCF